MNTGHTVDNSAEAGNQLKQAANAHYDTFPIKGAGYGAAAGGVVGTVVTFGLGTGIGAGIGATIGASIGNAIRKVKKSAIEAITFESDDDKR